MHLFFFTVPRTLIGWLLVGLIAGWLAGKVSRGRGFGCIANVLLGLVGAVLGGWIFSQLGILRGGFIYSLAAARLYMNPPRSMPSCEKIHPPSTAPTSPSKTFAMQPKPRPRETFPASQPAMRPTSSHPIKVRGTVKKKRCMECSFSAKLQLAPARALRGFLLRHTVYRAQTENQIETRNSNNCAGRKQISKLSEGYGVFRIVERRHEHNLIRNIKISVASGKPLPIEIHGCGHGQRFNAQHVAVLIFHLAKQRKILLQRFVIRFGRIFFNYGHHCRGIHETRQIVHVAVRVVPRDPVLDPQTVLYAAKAP